MENKGPRGEGAAGARAKLPWARPGSQSGARAGRTPGLEAGAQRVRGPRLSRGVNELSLRDPAAMLHSRRVPVI